jgi:hypothetical protein
MHDRVDEGWQDFVRALSALTFYSTRPAMADWQPSHQLATQLSRCACMAGISV